MQNMEIQVPQTSDRIHSNVAQLKWWEILFRKSNSLQNDRQIEAFHQDLDLPNNLIQTSKYTCINFIPKNLLQQFSKPPNLYFLIIGIFQTFPSISTTQGIPTMYIPLSIIVIFSAAKDLYEDYKRSVSDHLENQQQVIKIFQNNDQNLIESKNIRVGSVLKILKNEQIPCDGLLIYSPQPFAYVETKNLDGQTNLKRKSLLTSLRDQINIEQEGILFPRIKVQYQKPNTNMNSFKGKLLLNNQIFAITDSNVCLRGSTLKNIDYVYLLSLYTGHDTKILLCMNNPKSKKAALQVKLQKLIVIIFFSVLFISILLAFLKHKKHTARNLNNYSQALLYIISIISWVLNLTNFVPISLIVTLQAVRLFQGKIISFDQKMGSEQFPAKVNCSNIIQDLGLIDLIASDKTGTLTKNQLILRLISDGIDIHNQNSKDIPINILRVLTICHQAYVFNQEFESMSQDEVSILKFCKHHRSILLQRTQQLLILQLKGIVQKFKILHVIEFTSERKKQSVIFKNEQGKIFIVTKGADTQIDKISKHTTRKKNIFKDLNIFANRGYRTLIVASKQLQLGYINTWIKKYKLAQLDSNEITMKQLEVEIQSELDVICATGIQDELQDEVVETIQQILAARMKFIIISGDKPQTVMAIARNLKIATPFLAPTNQFKPEYLIHDLVIFARCTPRQKQQIVSNIQLRTLAIGDGANDVSMITKATIGIGVSGSEGKAAIQASDIAISQFKYLRRLLFLYGRECYRKNAEMVKYNFYKNFLYTYPQITFGFLSSFSGVYIYQTYLAQLFNLLFSSLPIIVFCLWDRQENEIDLVNNTNNQYMSSRKEVYFNNTAIFICFIESTILGLGISCIMFFLGIKMFRSPYDLTIIDISTILMLFIVIYVNLKVLIMTKRLTIGMGIICILGICLYFSALRIIFFISVDTNKSFKQLFTATSGIILMCCILVSLIITIILQFWNSVSYKVDMKQIYIE